MTDVRQCPTCGGRAKYKLNPDTQEETYKAVQDEEAFKKIAQVKKALEKSLAKCKALEAEISKSKR